MVLLDSVPQKPVDVISGDLHIRLAESSDEVRASQRLRYRVFCEEMSAQPTAEQRRDRREYDSFDDYCDHLLVFDRRKRGAEAVVGSYRLMRRAQAARRGQFYTKDEYNITALLDYPGEVLELGRSCVDSDYRSLPATDPDEIAEPLSYLYHHHLAPPALRPLALPERRVDMNILPPEAVNIRLAKRRLPPLVRGYLRLGGFVGDGAVVDYEFGTTDVAVVVKTDWVTEKYVRHYKSAADSARS